MSAVEVPAAVSTPSEKTEVEEKESEEEAKTPASGGRGRGARAGRRGRQSIPVNDPSSAPSRNRRNSAEKDDNKGQDYIEVPTGGDTGLSGKYWADMNNLPARRKRTSLLDKKKEEEEQKKKEEEAAKKEKATASAGKGRKAKKSSPETPAAPTPPPEASESDKSTPRTRGRPPKRKLPLEEDESPAAKKTAPQPPAESSQELKRKGKAGDEEASVMMLHSDFDKSRADEKKEETAKKFSGSLANGGVAEAVREAANEVSRATREADQVRAESGQPPAAVAAPNPAANRSVSCVADTSTQREAAVECFAPYDDHR